jgi:hypothetical protein
MLNFPNHTPVYAAPKAIIHTNFTIHAPTFSQSFWRLSTSGRNGPVEHSSLPPRPIPSSPVAGGRVRVTPVSKALLGRDHFTVTVDTRKPLKRIPRGFLATSHEWPRIQDYGTGPHLDAWARIFGTLGPDNIIRVGGASQENLREVSHEGLLV